MRARALTRLFLLRRLTRNSQIGEFYVMMPPQTEPMGDAKDNSRFKNTCDLLIFCEESDKHVRISWEDAWKNTMIGTSGGGKTLIAADATDLGGMTLTEWNNAAQAIDEFNKGTKSWAELTDKKNTANGKALDCRIVLARPFVEHMMHSAILAVSGRSTGATLFGPSDMQLSANTQVKTIEGHYTGRATAGSNSAPDAGGAHSLQSHRFPLRRQTSRASSRTIRTST